MTSIRPGPWWLKPLWSLRQHVDASIALRQLLQKLEPVGVGHRFRHGG
jgi:hypothetical protein